jgi:signal transduction histidine kinase
MAVTNSVTFISYLSICMTLFYLARRTKKAIAKDWGYFLVGFALFIVACGSTHLMEVVTTWSPVFWIDAWTNIITAALSGYVALQFARRAPELGFGINDYADRLTSSETENERIRESLLAARKLEEWNRMSAVISHEINNPLAAIGNLLFLIQISPGMTPELNAMVQQCSDEVRRIDVLTRSTLGFFRQGQGLEAVDLKASAESVRFLLGPVLRQRGIELEIMSEGKCTVQAYAVEVRQVLLNLVRNACEATSQRDVKVKIELHGRAEDVEIVVADVGSGIEAALIPTLFQFGMSTKGDRGNGMGLWLVKQLVSRHGGTINVDSKIGEGSRFVVCWPRTIPVQMASEGTPALQA